MLNREENSYTRLPYKNTDGSTDIRVYQRSPRHQKDFWDRRRKIIRAAAEHFANMLKIEDTWIKIKVHKNNDLPGTFTGWCEQETYCEYEIQIQRNLHIAEALFVLAHEMVHVKQFRSKKLKMTGDDTFWKGERIEADYEDQPWEQEAYDLMKPMLKDFCEHHRAIDSDCWRAIRIWGFNDDIEKYENIFTHERNDRLNWA